MEMNKNLNQLLTQKSQLLEKQNKLNQELNELNNQIGAAKFGAKVGERFIVESTKNTYVVDSYDDESIFVRQVKVKDGVESLGMAMEARFWFDYRAGKAKTPTRR